MSLPDSDVLNDIAKQAERLAEEGGAFARLARLVARLAEELAHSARDEEPEE